METLESVVPVDHATVQIVEVRGREASTVKRDQRAKVGRNDGDHLHHHPLGPVAAVPEGLDNLETLGVLTTLGL